MTSLIMGTAVAILVAAIVFGIGYSAGFARGYLARKHMEKVLSMGWESEIEKGAMPSDRSREATAERLNQASGPGLATSKRPIEPWVSTESRPIGHGVQHWR